jgi:hypothetical protein
MPWTSSGDSTRSNSIRQISIARAATARGMQEMQLQIGQVLDILTREFLLPLQGRHDLGNELRQPGSGMRLVDRDRIRFRFEEIAAISEHNRLQMKFEGLPVGVQNRREINVRNRIAADKQRSGQGFCGFVERAGVEKQIVYRDVALAQQGPRRSILPPPKTPWR